MLAAGTKESDAARPALIADVGRAALRVGVTDAAGRFRPDTIRTFTPTAEPTVSGAISTVAREHGLSGQPIRLAVAVSGIPRGDTISVTHGRWRISRSGLASMLQTEPLILNDFAANGWAIAAHEQALLEPLVGNVVMPQRPGTYCIIGVGSGLGVAILHRDVQGHVTVLPTEAGHCAFPTGLAGIDQVAAKIAARDGTVTAESLISAPGLATIHAALSDVRVLIGPGIDAKEVIRLGQGQSDDRAARALDLFACALWHFAGNMVLAHGAFDGVILTGSVAGSLRKLLIRPQVAQHFTLRGPFQRFLTAVPRSLSAMRNAELTGAAIALSTQAARAV